MCVSYYLIVRFCDIAQFIFINVLKIATVQQLTKKQNQLRQMCSGCSCCESAAHAHEHQKLPFQINQQSN